MVMVHDFDTAIYSLRWSIFSEQLWENGICIVYVLLVYVILFKQFVRLSPICLFMCPQMNDRTSEDPQRNSLNKK